MKKARISNYHGSMFVEIYTKSFHEDGIAFPIEEDEIYPILKACKEYLEKHIED